MQFVLMVQCIGRTCAVFYQSWWRRSTKIVLSLRKKCLLPSRHMKKHQLKNWRKKLHGVTTSKWRVRSNLTLLMVLLVTSILGITSLQMQKPSHYLDKSPSAGLRTEWISTWIRYWKLKEKIMLLLLTPIPFILIWVLWSKVYTREERKLLKALSRSLIRSVRWNLKNILTVATKNWPTT